MSATIYLEGGGNSKELHIRCREGFRKLLESCGFKAQRRMPRLIACDGRADAFSDFQAHHQKGETNYVAMLIDSEEPIKDLEATWQHLKDHDGWNVPDGAFDEQVLFMTTCMETWIVSDRPTLVIHYGTHLQESALPELTDMETRTRQEVQQKLAHATRNCANAYTKGKRSSKCLESCLRPNWKSTCRASVVWCVSSKISYEQTQWSAHLVVNHHNTARSRSHFHFE